MPVGCALNLFKFGRRRLSSLQTVLGDDPNSASQADASLILPRAGGAIQQGRSRDLLHGLISIPLLHE